MSDMEEDYGFEYSDDDYAEEDVDIENQYYNSKGEIESDDLEQALQGFQEVIAMEDGRGEWGFKALKQIVKIYFRMNRYDDMLEAYSQMLGYANEVVTRNAAEKKINSTLEFISHSTDPTLLQKCYSLTLQGLADAKNDRLWFKTNIKLVNLWISLNEREKALAVLEELKESCKDDDGSRKGTQLLEVYALEIQLLSESRHASRRELSETYQKALEIKSAIPHPKIMGIIREYGGKMHMNSRRWEEAATDFFEAFKSYDEAGSVHRSRCLKYLVLANMMMESSVDPFDSQEARPYRSDPAVSAMTRLVEAYQSSDIQAFENALKQGNNDIAGDTFVAPYIEDLRRNLCSKVIIASIQPYSRVKIDHLRSMLSAVTTINIDELLLTLILGGKIKAKINQATNTLEIDKGMDTRDAKLEALSSWADSLSALQARMTSRLAI